MDRLSLWAPDVGLFAHLGQLLLWVSMAAATSLILKLLHACSVARRDLRVSALILEKLPPEQAQRILQEIQHDGS